MSDLAEFRRSLDGEVFDPDSPGYDEVRRPADLVHRQVRPRLVVTCRSASDVVAAIAHARATGDRIVHRGRWAVGRRVVADRHPDGSGRVYPNFPDPALDD